MLTWLRKLIGAAVPSGAASPRARPIRAGYDSARHSDETAKHWAQADALSARSANSLEVRQTLRNRARYEVANNSYAKGIVLTLANNLVGPGPRLQVTGPDEASNRRVEAAWAQWAGAARLADKLRVMVQAKKVDGEAFAILTTNPMLRSPVQLDFRPLECDQVTTPFPPVTWNGDYVDGLEFDPHGNVTVYHVLRVHPGATAVWHRWRDWYVRLPARSVVHWFRADRPGQARGVPELTPALPLFALLRRHTLATLHAAEVAACFAGVLETAAPADGDTDEPTPFESLEIERGMLTTLPSGAKLSQLKPEHPSSTHEAFVWCILREAARCLNLPLNIALGDSSRSNFSSARLDHLVYRQAVEVERSDCEAEVLEPTLQAWLDEAVMIPGLLPDGTTADATALPHAWHWPAWEPIDPKVEADTEVVRLAGNTGTLAEIAGRHGQDWRELIRQQEAEAAYRIQVRAEAGLPPEEAEPRIGVSARREEAARASR